MESLNSRGEEMGWGGEEVERWEVGGGEVRRWGGRGWGGEELGR